ncbi:hypothetical protein D3C81_1785450 [compost metagenome]
MCVFVQNFGDFAHFSVHGCSNDDPFTTPVGHERRHERHVALVPNWGLSFFVQVFGVFV